jgi:L-lysine 2,3-aminomutase
LKRIGRETGYKMFNQICLKRGIYERPQTMTSMMKTLQQKVFKHLFAYEANSFYTAVKDD